MSLNVASILIKLCRLWKHTEKWWIKETLILYVRKFDVLYFINIILLKKQTKSEFIKMSSKT